MQLRRCRLQSRNPIYPPSHLPTSLQSASLMGPGLRPSSSYSAPLRGARQKAALHSDLWIQGLEG